jgi:hypothetical protein
MKKQNKTKYLIFSALAFVLVVGATRVFAAPGDMVSPLIHKGAGSQLATELRLGASADTSALLDVNQTGKNAVFDGINGTSLDTQTFMTVLGNSWFQDKVFVGKNRDAVFNYSPSATFPSPPLSPIPVDTKASASMNLWTNSYTAGTPILQKINIFGGILSTDMNTAAGNITGTGQVCVDSVGTLILC